MNTDLTPRATAVIPAGIATASLLVEFKHVKQGETYDLTTKSTANKLLTLVCDGRITINESITIVGNSVLDLSRAESITIGNECTLTLGPGATLILSDTAISSPLSGSAFIIGNEAVFQAPPRHVFATNVIIGGSWAIDRAYPQWFTPAKLYTTEAEANNDKANWTDWAPAINAAIRMKNSGEVSLPRGVYTVKSTIFTHYGIRLVGTGASSRQEKTPLHVTGTIILALRESNEFRTGACVLRWDNLIGDFKLITEEATTDYRGPYMIAVNFRESSYNTTGTDTNNKSLDGDYDFDSPDTITTIEYIRLSTKEPVISGVGASEINGIYAHGSVALRHIVFEHLGTAFLVDPKYSDCQEIINCGYRRKWENPFVIEKPVEELTRFAFCRLGNGDAFRMEGCYVGSYDNIGALFMKKCGGGSISNNIFNSHVVLADCMNTVYSANHSEAGGQLMILRSIVNASSNFFEKGRLPSIRLRGNIYGDFAIINLSNSYFVLSDGFHFHNENTNNEATNLQNLKLRLQNTSEYDIEIDGTSSLTVNQNYRTLNLYGKGNSLPKTHTYGIRIGLTRYKNSDFAVSNHEISNFEWYNLRSCYLTPGCQITSENVISHLSPIPTTSSPISYLSPVSTTNQVEWSGPEVNSLMYYFKILPPGEKYNAKTLPSQSITAANDQLPKAASGGVFFSVRTSSTQNRSNLYIVRSFTLNGTEHLHEVYIPLCFTPLLYDNWITLSSFKWSEVEPNYFSPV